ncbi:unnamed protein product, partial [Didymodactylos carnosus]
PNCDIVSTLTVCKYCNCAKCTFANILNNADDRQIDACRHCAVLIIGALHGYSKEQLLDTKFCDEHLLKWFNNQKSHKDAEKIANGDQCHHHHHLQSLQLALETFKNDENDIEQGYIPLTESLGSYEINVGVGVRM